MNHTQTMKKQSTKKKIDKDTKMSAEVLHQMAAALGRLGGLKGGKRRAQVLSAERRSEIAKNAVEIRWAKHKKK